MQPKLMLLWLIAVCLLIGCVSAQTITPTTTRATVNIYVTDGGPGVGNADVWVWYPDWPKDSHIYLGRTGSNGYLNKKIAVGNVEFYAKYGSGQITYNRCGDAGPMRVENKKKYTVRIKLGAC